MTPTKEEAPLVGRAERRKQERAMRRLIGKWKVKTNGSHRKKKK